MFINETNADSKNVYWYVMLHLEPALIERQLTLVNENRKRYGLPPILFIIPFRYMERAIADKALQQQDSQQREVRERMKEVDDHNYLRNIMHDFVFIKATKSQIDVLCAEEWNVYSRLRLHYYRNRSGNPIRVADDEMMPLITLFVEQRRKFTFRPAIDEELSLQHTVRIKRGLFKNYHATIQHITHTNGQTRLTLGIPVFNNEVTLEIYECSIDDIDIPGGQSSVLERFLDPYFFRGIEKELFEILRQRVLRRETPDTAKVAQQKLKSYTAFSHLKFEDVVEQTHFCALLLLCATLLKDIPTKSTLVTALIRLIPDVANPTSDEEAFLLAILFVATRKGIYRKTVKTYVQQHDVVLPSLMALMPIIKQINTR